MYLCFFEKGLKVDLMFDIFLIVMCSVANITFMSKSMLKTFNLFLKHPNKHYQVTCKSDHPSKVMLRIIINQLKSKAEEILSEEQAGFGRAQSTVKQMFNGRVLVEKYLQHQKDFFHNFINFKDTFDHGSCVAQVSLQVMRNFNIDEELVQVVRV